MGTVYTEDVLKLVRYNWTGGKVDCGERRDANGVRIGSNARFGSTRVKKAILYIPRFECNHFGFSRRNF